MEIQGTQESVVVLRKDEGSEVIIRHNKFYKIAEMGNGDFVEFFEADVPNST